MCCVWIPCATLHTTIIGRTYYKRTLAARNKTPFARQWWLAAQLGFRRPARKLDWTHLCSRGKRSDRLGTCRSRAATLMCYPLPFFFFRFFLCLLCLAFVFALHRLFSPLLVQPSRCSTRSGSVWSAPVQSTAVPLSLRCLRHTHSTAPAKISGPVNRIVDSGAIYLLPTELPPTTKKLNFRPNSAPETHLSCALGCRGDRSQDEVVGPFSREEGGSAGAESGAKR